MLYCSKRLEVYILDTPKTAPSKRAANDKWDKENMSTIGCKVKKTQAEAFKKYASQRGKTANTLLKEFVVKCITEDTIEKDSPED